MAIGWMYENIYLYGTGKWRALTDKQLYIFRSIVTEDKVVHKRLLQDKNSYSYGSI